ncbi:MAG: esterase [Candidatus Lokiarchaeota archaeon]|nr:esterase [Candidatus Lokiarchaeota archaeon]
MKIKRFQIESDFVPSPVEYDVLFPKEYENSDKIYPLMLLLHGGGNQDRNFLNLIGPIIWDLWEEMIVPEMVIVTPNCNHSLYMDYKDGSEKWESFIIREFLPYLQKEYRVTPDVNNAFIGGVSMGGLGSLRLGFKYLDKFRAVVSFEPGIEPAFEWKEVKTIDKFYRQKDFMEKVFGSPIDEDYWNKNNPAFIVRETAEKIRNSDIKIYLEVGTEDFFGLFRGAEFLHRILFDRNIRHEFRYVYGADHLGVSFRERIINGFSFLNRIINPLEEPLDVIKAREFFIQMKENALRKEEK